MFVFQGNWTKPGTVVLLYDRKYEDNENQLWDLIPYGGTDASSLLSPTKGSFSDDEDEDYSFSSASYAL